MNEMDELQQVEREEKSGPSNRLENGGSNVHAEGAASSPNKRQHGDHLTTVETITVGTATNADKQMSTTTSNDGLSDDDDVFFEEAQDQPSKVVVFCRQQQGRLGAIINEHRQELNQMAIIIAVLGYLIYFGFAMTPEYGRPAFPIPNPTNIFDNNPGLALLILSAVVLLFVAWETFVFYSGDQWSGRLDSCLLAHRKAIAIVRILVICLLLALIAIYLTMTVGMKSPRNFVSLGGLVVFIFVMFAFSKHPGRVKWGLVLYGVILQFALAVLVINTHFGLSFFEFFSKQFTSFLSYAKAGTTFVFGKLDCFAFEVLPILIFFSAVANVLFYSGMLKYVTKKVAWCMSLLMGTTAGESFNAVASTFLGQSEGPMLIKSMLPVMTSSELHAVMTAGFATIAGSVMGAYILFKVPAYHLIAASIMSAPAAMVAAKLLYPETKKSRSTWSMVDHLPKAKEKNIIEALCNGAAQSIPIVANIAVNLIAFLSLLAFLNAVTCWIFGNVQHPEIDFQKLLAWGFYPVAWLMGVSSRDCLVVGELLGIKTFLNEFIAYQKLGKIIDLRDGLLRRNASALESYGGVDSMLFERRSIVITTYALCGHSNLVAIGIELGGLVALAPTRRRTLSKIALRAMIAGNIACLMTACVAGLLYDEPPTH